MAPVPKPRQKLTGQSTDQWTDAILVGSLSQSTLNKLQGNQEGTADLAFWSIVYTNCAGRGTFLGRSQNSAF